MTLEENLAKPVIISVGVTGSVTTRAQLPWLPVSPSEIAESAVAAAQAGASVVHIHVREADGTPSARVEVYEETFELIRAASDVLICATTGSGAGLFNHGERLSALPLLPEIASLDCGSMNFGERIFENPPAFLRRLAHEITSRGIVPEIECFDLGMVENVRWLAKEGLLPGPTGQWWFQFCLGVRGGAPCDARALMTMRAMLPAGAEWSVLGVGRGQLVVNLLALVEGGHIRTGLEDNIYYQKGKLAKSNAQLVERIVKFANEVGRPVATPEQARQLLQCGPSDRSNPDQVAESLVDAIA
jgi:3-keto-5-aminohexanoate cleavage enzyme